MLLRHMAYAANLINMGWPGVRAACSSGQAAPGQPHWAPAFPAKPWWPLSSLAKNRPVVRDLYGLRKQSAGQI